MDKRKMSQSGATTAAGRMAYEGKVGVEAVVRSGGKNPQLKGVVHEILYRDSITMAPDNLIHGTKGALSKSATAIRDDVLTMQGGKVIGRAQLKDTVSSINKTVQAYYNTWWHEYAAHEAERAETERNARTEEARTKRREKWTRKLAFWKKVQLVMAYMLLSLLPVVAIVYYLFPTFEKLMLAVLPPYTLFILVGAHVSSFVVRHLEENAF